ncbi:MAG: ParB/RepB/Spo0J family partition protein [Alphaproteobacteria bacterium]|nr:ParB/RepB/Spo0J family partition protein [Alphaproteobacteria bacterium]
MTDKPDPKNRGLGRGLNALFDDDEDIAAAAAEDEAPSGPARGRQIVSLDQLQPGKFQPRQVFDEEALSQLAESLKIHGLLQPILVRPLSEDSSSEDRGRYEIIAGERRWRAAQKAQLHEVSVIIKTLSDSQALEIALIENLQREDLNPIDEAQGYKKLLEEFSHTQEQLAKLMGKSRPHIANTLRLLSLPDKVQRHVSEGRLSAGHARALVTAKDPEGLAEKIMGQGLSVRQTERLAADDAGRTVKSRTADSASASSPRKARGKDADTLALEAELGNALGMRVSIESDDGSQGRIVVEFKTLDQLDEILHRLSHFPGSRLTG